MGITAIAVGVKGVKLALCKDFSHLEGWGQIYLSMSKYPQTIPISYLSMSTTIKYLISTPPKSSMYKQSVSNQF